ncbi:MAG: monovalent cation/H(+) antiporter subunit G [Acidimicrobiales bacterium]
MSVRHVLALVLLVLGVGLEVVCCVGVLSMRGALDRLHFTGPAPLGAACVAAAIAADGSSGAMTIDAIVVALFLLVTSPMLVHVTARAVLIRTRSDWRPEPDDNLEVEER